MALRSAAIADEVLLLLPEKFPHKEFHETGFDVRLRLVESAVDHENVSVGSTAGGLFLEMAREVAVRFPRSRLAFVCGRDAAERIFDWHYAEEGALGKFFSVAALWVFARQGSFQPPCELAERILLFDFDERLQALSSTEVRRRLVAGEEWRSLAPESIHEEIERIYTPK